MMFSARNVAMLVPFAVSGIPSAAALQCVSPGESFMYEQYNKDPNFDLDKLTADQKTEEWSIMRRDLVQTVGEAKVIFEGVGTGIEFAGRPEDICGICVYVVTFKVEKLLKGWLPPKANIAVSAWSDGGQDAKGRERHGAYVSETFAKRKIVMLGTNNWIAASNASPYRPTIQKQVHGTLGVCFNSSVFDAVQPLADVDPAQQLTPANVANFIRAEAKRVTLEGYRRQLKAGGRP